MQATQLFYEKIWEIWEFFSEKYGRNMGDFGIFMAKFGKNMGNMGEFQPFFPDFFHIFNHQNVISKKKKKRRSSKFYVNPMPSENDLDDTEI